MVKCNFLLKISIFVFNLIKLTPKMKKNYYYTLLLCLIAFGSSFAQKYKKMIETGTFTVQQIQQAAEDHFAIVGLLLY